MAGFDWTALIGPGVAGLTNLLGADEATSANDKAAQIARDTSAQNIKTIQDANARAASTIQPITEYAKPGLDYMRGVVARSPFELTPQQRIELSDRQTMAMRMVPKSLAGSGRYTTAMVNDVANRGRAGMISDNTNRADTMARGIAGTGTNATISKASIEAGQGPQIASQNSMGGDATANAATANGTIGADAMGSIGAYFANAMKDQQRDTRYNTYKSAYA